MPQFPFRLLRPLAVTAALFIAHAAQADDFGRVTLTEENDSIYFNDDQAYTQGFEFNYLGPDVAAESGWAAPFDGFANIGLFDTGAEVSRRYQIIFGQSIFTPEDTSVENPDPDDRPYAGWTYGGVSWVQDTDRRRLDNLELLIGIVGPAAQARPAQNDWHQFIGVDDAEGWDHQIHNEPGLMLSYERKYRFIQPLVGGFAIDAIPEAGVTLGNVMTYGEIGTMLRFGRNLEADYGPNRIRPSLSGTSYFNADYLEDPFGFYVYVGTQGRAVAQNIFLDGNTFRDSRSVDKEIFVGDITGGVALFWSNSIKLDAGFTYRTQEFEGQDDAAKFANINLTVGF
nr:lipid A deacylase LpxR family protein [uncultured Dongia sp.]